MGFLHKSTQIDRQISVVQIWLDVKQFLDFSNTGLFIKSSKNFQRYTAFTLSEVLITLGIIGVIAAITIPALMNNINDMQYKTALKKNLAVLNQAMTQANYDYGGYGHMYPGNPPQKFDPTGVNFGNPQQFAQFKLAQYLPVTKYCSVWTIDASGSSYKPPGFTVFNETQNGLMDAGCWSTPSDKIKALNSRMDLSFFNQNLVYGGTLVLSNGAFIGVSQGYDCVNCDNSQDTILIDVNGMKGPNIMGKDIQLLFLNVRTDGYAMFSPVYMESPIYDLKAGAHSFYTDNIAGKTCIDNSSDENNTGVTCAEKFLSQ